MSMSLRPSPLPRAVIEKALIPVFEQVLEAYQKLRTEALELIEAIANTHDEEALEDSIDALEWLPRLAVRKVLAETRVAYSLEEAILEELESAAGLQLIGCKGWQADASKFQDGKLIEPIDVHFAKQLADLHELQDNFCVTRVSHRIYGKENADTLRKLRGVGRNKTTHFKNLAMCKPD